MFRKSQRSDSTVFSSNVMGQIFKYFKLSAKECVIWTICILSTNNYFRCLILESCWYEAAVVNHQFARLFKTRRKDKDLFGSCFAVTFLEECLSLKSSWLILSGDLSQICKTHCFYSLKSDWLRGRKWVFQAWLLVMAHESTS